MPQFHFTAKVFYRPNLHLPGDRFDLTVADATNLATGGSGHLVGGCDECTPKKEDPDAEPVKPTEPARPDAPADGPPAEGPAACELCGKKFPGGAAALAAHRLQKHKK